MCELNLWFQPIIIGRSATSLRTLLSTCWLVGLSVCWFSGLLVSRLRVSLRRQKVKHSHSYWRTCEKQKPLIYFFLWTSERNFIAGMTALYPSTDAWWIGLTDLGNNDLNLFIILYIPSCYLVTYMPLQIYVKHMTQDKKLYICYVMMLWSS